MKLIEQISIDDVTPHLEDDKYAIDEIDGKKYLYFKCPGCDAVISITDPPWKIDFNNFTALSHTGSYSILHTAPDGCGWHGYLTNKELHL